MTERASVFWKIYARSLGVLLALVAAMHALVWSTLAVMDATGIGPGSVILAYLIVGFAFLAHREAKDADHD